MKKRAEKANNCRYKKVNPPFGYFGSKNKLAFWLCENLPPHNCWIEVFCGSAAVTLAKPPAPIEIINDLNSEITNVFKQLRNNRDKLCEKIALTPYSLQELNEARNAEISLDDLERARLFLIKSMMAINGVFGKERGGFSTSNSYARDGKEARVNRWYNLPERLFEVSERLRKTRIENRDACDLLIKFEKRPATLAYLDPPYLGDRTNGYDFDANDVEYHKRLLTICNRSSCMIFISGYENDLYDSMLSPKDGWVKKTMETTTRGVNGNDNSRLEVVWMNKNFIRSLKTKTIPIELSANEKQNKKLNPERG